MTSRERVRRTLRFETPDRVPRCLGTLPWAHQRYPEVIQQLHTRFPDDLGGVPSVYRPSPRARGDWYALGQYTDEWGCVFENLQAGVHGEVRAPIIAELEDWRRVQPPYEILPEDWNAARDIVNRHCAESPLFLWAACCPQPWERYQFLRGTANAMLDMMDFPPAAQRLLRAIHDFYLKECEFWMGTAVDALFFMDDWGSQRQLLLPPQLWRTVFKPLYRDYCAFAHAHGKFAIMHSDGYILEILDDLIEIGVDAVNAQIFCMDLAELGRRFKGRITFMGEIDRQHVLTSPDPEVGRRAVREVARHLYDPRGGVIAHFEFGAGAQPQTVLVIFEEWEQIDRRHRGPAPA